MNNSTIIIRNSPMKRALYIFEKELEQIFDMLDFLSSQFCSSIPWKSGGLVLNWDDLMVNTSYVVPLLSQLLYVGKETGP